jgi:hypothetical protein
MPPLNAWLRWLQATATIILVAALCVAVASALSGLGRLGGVSSGVAVDSSGWVTFGVHDPSLVDRLLHMLTQVPGLLLIAEIARRMANLLRAARAGDPFTADSVHALTTLGKLTAVAGLATWVISQVAQGALSARMLTSAPTYQPQHTPLGWIAVGLLFGAFARILDSGVSMRTELDTVI